MQNNNQNTLISYLNYKISSLSQVVASTDLGIRFLQPFYTYRRTLLMLRSSKTLLLRLPLLYLMVSKSFRALLVFLKLLLAGIRKQLVMGSIPLSGC
jgi:hypothetical protein